MERPLLPVDGFCADGATAVDSNDLSVQEPVLILDEPPYSPKNELQYFMSKGIPLGIAAFLEWGAPPWLTMFMAGHTEDSASLQAALGYGRVFYNCTVFMMLFGFSNYIGSVVPGCIGAGRKDRIPAYFQRGMLLTSVFMLPFLAVQFFASPILEALSVPENIASQVGVYCRLMTITAWFMSLELHMNTVFTTLGYARASAINSFLTGLGVDVVCNYLFLYRWGWGVQGAALAQMAVKISRVLVWIAIMLILGETQTLSAKPKEPLLSRTELKMFVTLSAPTIVSNFSSWFVFELQIMGLANITNISASALAAGAIWVQCESTIASIQSGWILSTRIRTLTLLGKQDPGAWRSLALLSVMSTLLVALLNVPLLLFPTQVAQIVSNEVEVQQWFSDALWVLAIHSQSRVTCLNATCLFLSMGQSTVGVLLNFVCFYCIASPIAGIVALTDIVTTSMRWKLIACVSTTSMAQILATIVGYGYLVTMDWEKAASLIAHRANNDLH